MPMRFDINRPIYQQIIEYIKKLLINGVYPPGAKIPSVRELALEMEVNPNTMQKALSELEREGYLVSERTSGRFVTQDKSMIEDLKAEIQKAIIAKFIEDMNSLGIKQEEILRYIAQYMERMK